MLAYRAPKYVVVVDPRFVSVRVLSILFAIFYCIGYHILYLGLHLRLDSMDSEDLQMRFLHPSQDCDPIRSECERMQRIPAAMCSGTRDGDDKLNHPEKRPCKLFETAEFEGRFPKGFIPTRIRRYWRKRNCTEEEIKNHSCTDGARMMGLRLNGTFQKNTKSGYVEPVMDMYVDQVRQWTVAFEHRALFAVNGEHEDVVMDGYYRKPHTGERVKMLACQSTAWGAHRRLYSLLQDRLHSLVTHDSTSQSGYEGQQTLAKDPEDRQQCPTIVGKGSSDQILQTQRGDRAALGKLLLLAGAEMDEVVCPYGDACGHMGQTRRSRGMKVKLTLIYDNVLDPSWRGLQVTPWWSPEVFYTYELSLDDTVDNFMVQDNFKVEPAQQWLTGDMRMEDVDEMYYGVQFEVGQVSRVKIFDMGNFGLILCEAITIYATATFMADLLLQLYYDRYAQQVNYEVDVDETGDETKESTSEQAANV